MCSCSDKNKGPQLRKPAFNRREFLQASVAAGAFATQPSPGSEAAPHDSPSGHSEKSTYTFVIQWQAVNPVMPWLSEVAVRAFSSGVRTETAPLLDAPGQFPHGVRVTLTKQDRAAAAWVQVKMGGGYGFLLSDQMLDRHAYLWLREMGIYISRLGTWEETEKKRAEAAALIQRSLERPYLSCAEKYYQWTGHVEQGIECKKFGEAGSGLDDKVWDFVQAKEKWPVVARSLDHIDRTPEVDAAYFTDRFPDVQYSNMYVGWPNHDDKFLLWDCGKIGVSSFSVGGDPKKPWLPRASGYTLQFGVGTAPRFRKHGDESVRQHLKNGFDLIVVTEWSDAGTKVAQTNFAYPLDGEEIKTGIEPMLNWTEMRVSNDKPFAVDTCLGIEFTNEDPFLEKPKINLHELRWRNGGIYVGDEMLMVTDPSLTFEEIPTEGNFKRFRALMRLPASGQVTYTFANFYRAASPARLSDVQKLGYDVALSRTMAFWDRLQAQGCSIMVPDPLLNNLFRTFLPRVTISAAIDPHGRAVLRTGPVDYAYTWFHTVAFGIAHYLCRGGYFDFAKLYLEPFFVWQGTPIVESQRRKGMAQPIKNWRGLFGAPPEQCPIYWMMFHGVIQWACARYVTLSGDQAWLNSKLPALLDSLDWTKEARGFTKKLNADGSKPLNYGWLPPEQVDDGTFGTSIYTDAHIWRGMDALTQVLESIHHPRAAEFRAEADDYHTCLENTMRTATAERPLGRLNDDTWVLYMPLLLERTPGQVEATLWFAAVDSTVQTLLETQVFDASSVENSCLVNYFEDSYSPLAPGLPDAAPNAFHAGEYLRRDLIKNFLYTFYSQSTMTLARQTLTMYEMRSPGKDRIFELPPSSAGLWTVNFADMLCRTVGDELWLMQATPRRWLKHGEAIEVKQLQTEFGPISYSVHSSLGSGSIEAKVTPPTRHPARRLKIRFRAPDGRKMQAVTVNGDTWRDFNAEGEWVTISEPVEPSTIVVRY
jgi:hypothetical protein